MINEKFIIAGGIPRKFGELLSPGHVLKKAEIALVDYFKKKYDPKLTYESNPEYCADILPSIGFTSFSVDNDTIYIGTSTEVLFLDKKTFKIKSILTDPLFNDIHHVKIINNHLYVVVTGMDALFEFDLNFKRTNIFNTLGKNPFHKFDKNDNLNKVASTKPHESHPNHVFSINGEIWVTRFTQKDAICITDFSKRFDIGVGYPHDGIVKGDLVYFTTVNGYVVVFNKNSLEKVSEIKLSGPNGKSLNTPLGWCRGLYIDEEFMYVGFTQLRTTKITENLAWLKNIINEKKVQLKPAPTRIEKYTLKGEHVSEFRIPSNGVFTIFGIEKI